MANPRKRRSSNILDQEDAEEIRRRYSLGNVTQSELASEYGVTQSNISRIINNHVWS